MQQLLLLHLLMIMQQHRTMHMLQLRPLLKIILLKRRRERRVQICLMLQLL